jgi:hypothetical protein
VLTCSLGVKKEQILEMVSFGNESTDLLICICSCARSIFTGSMCTGAVGGGMFVVSLFFLLLEERIRVWNSLKK